MNHRYLLVPPPPLRTTTSIHSHPIRQNTYVYRNFKVSLTAFATSLALLGSAYAETFDHNIALKQSGSSRIYDSLTLNIYATGDTYQNNYEDPSYGYEDLINTGTALVVWQNNVLTVNGDLNLNVTPAPWAGSKLDMDRRGISMQNAGSLEVGGNASILVDNYKHTDDYYWLIDSGDEEYDYGLNAQMGITLEDEGTFAHFAKNLNVTMLDGNRSTGIYARSDAELVVDGDTTINVSDAAYYTYGISNRYSDQNYGLSPLTTSTLPKLHFKGDLSITTSGGNNSIGINLQSNTTASSGFLTVDGHLKVHASGATEYKNKTDLQTFPDSVGNYGIFLCQVAGQGAQFNTAEITATSYNKDTQTYTEGAEAIGIYATWNSNLVFAGDASVTAVAGDNDTEIAILARSGAYISFARGLRASGSVALNAMSNTFGAPSSIYVNTSMDESASVQIEGNIVVGKTDAIRTWGDYDHSVDTPETANIIEANFLNEQSFFTGINEFGTTDPDGETASEINLHFANRARWNLTGSTQVSSLVASNQGIINMTYSGTDDFQTLRAETLSGEGGVVAMDINASLNVDNSDRLFVDGEHSGQHIITLNNIGSSTEGAEGTVLVSVGTEKGAFVANDTEGSLYWNRYQLAKQESQTEGYTTDWVLESVQQDPDEETSTTEMIKVSGASDYFLWRQEMDILRERLGELRSIASPDLTGSWAKVSYGSIGRSGSSSFDANAFRLQAGLDQGFAVDNGRFYAGAAIDLRKGETDYNQGAGKNNAYGLNLYFTALRDSGSYLEMLLRYAHMTNELDGHDLDGNALSLDTSGDALSLAVELGHTFNLTQSWFVEPYAKVMFGRLWLGDDTTSNGVHVDFDDMTSLIGRLGVNLGARMSDHMNFTLGAAVLKEFDGDYEATLRSANELRRQSESYDDTWGVFGLTANYRCNENAYVYGSAQVETGTSDMDTGYVLRAGFRYAF